MKNVYSDEVGNKWLVRRVREGDQKALDTLKLRASRGGRGAKNILEQISALGTLVKPPSITRSLSNPMPIGHLPDLYPWQEKALKAWEQNGCSGIVEAVTGAGKTVLGLSAVKSELEAGGRVLVLVPSIILLQQWTERLRETFPKARVGTLGGGGHDSFATKDIIVSVVNSARAFIPQLGARGGLLVADECHRYGAISNASALKETFSRRLGLSATFARSDDGHTEYLLPYFGKVVFSLNYVTAVEEKAICSFSVTFVGVDIGEEDLALYEKHSREAAKYRGRLINQGGVTAEPFGKFIQEVQDLSKGGAGKMTQYARNYLNDFSKRRQILANSSNKISALAGLIENIRVSNRAIIFTQTIDAAKLASALLTCLGVTSDAIHSDMLQRERESVLRKFKAGSTKAIVAPQVLDEGVDVPAADVGVIVAASSTRRQMIQRMGRVLRNKENGGKAAFYILYARGTSEDPNSGAHEQFIEDITIAAENIYQR